MKKALKQLAIGLLSSKKATVFLTGLLLTLVVYPLTRWLGLEHEAALEIAKVVVAGIVSVALPYLLAQGVADKGKGQIEQLVKLAQEDPAAAALVAKLLTQENKG